jgi:serine/threonine-protein kinase
VCLTDRPLFRADHEAETMMQVLQKSIPPPSAYAPGLGIAMDRVCLRALERDPARRFPSAAAFADALAQAARDRFFEPREVGDLVETLRHDVLEGLRSGVPVSLPPEEQSGPDGSGESTTVEVPRFDFEGDNEDEAETEAIDAPTQLHQRTSERASQSTPAARPPEASEPTLVLDPASGGARPEAPPPASAAQPLHLASPSLTLPREARSGRGRKAAWIAAVAVAAGGLFIFALAPSSPHEPGTETGAEPAASAAASVSAPVSAPARGAEAEAGRDGLDAVHAARHLIRSAG